MHHLVSKPPSSPIPGPILILFLICAPSSAISLILASMLCCISAGALDSTHSSRTRRTN
ncbi:hypothetical protein CHLRE_13g603776v5 [Chlamydomonas reinhardtii]|uniref:Uncharacterized protein n=1 Tax=Chlamydomonas reinhardtii TaxID=3055 RepID=A0A2K3D1A7_CHLRE|nr:uncharacterized protein CHLRE_13g603776v5 [Chlamydomonas reinhardtii]PNW74321.1 hypothetical protein CHLRE_13g603776v5 [Chlamydomonas reinhardtii]